jgi:hypothetical protein
VCETWPLVSQKGASIKIFRMQKNYAVNMGPMKEEVSDISKIHPSFNEELCRLVLLR